MFESKMTTGALCLLGGVYLLGLLVGTYSVLRTKAPSRQESNAFIAATMLCAMPLAILEAFMSPGIKAHPMSFIVLGSLLTVVGVAAAVFMFWLSRLKTRERLQRTLMLLSVQLSAIGIGFLMLVYVTGAR